MSKYCITFGAGNDNYIKAGERLFNQVNNTNYFDRVILFTDKDLKDDIEFWNRHGEFIEKNKRGYGYWLWKPYLIKKTMEKMKDNDILLYLDCGCEIGAYKKNQIPKFFEFVKKDKLIGSVVKSAICIEKEWNKMDLILHLQMNNEKFINTPQRQAGVVMYLVCEETRKLVSEWYDIACNYHMKDDSPSISKNINGFREHRHDQSIFSLLTKKYNLFSDKDINDCVFIYRNRTGKSRLRK